MDPSATSAPAPAPGEQANGAAAAAPQQPDAPAAQPASAPAATDKMDIDSEPGHPDDPAVAAKAAEIAKYLKDCNEKEVPTVFAQLVTTVGAETQKRGEESIKKITELVPGLDPKQIEETKAHVTSLKNRALGDVVATVTDALASKTKENETMKQEFERMRGEMRSVLELKAQMEQMKAQQEQQLKIQQEQQAAAAAAAKAQQEQQAAAAAAAAAKAQQEQQAAAAAKVQQEQNQKSQQPSAPAPAPPTQKMDLSADLRRSKKRSADALLENGDAAEKKQQSSRTQPVQIGSLEQSPLTNYIVAFMKEMPIALQNRAAQSMEQASSNKRFAAQGQVGFNKDTPLTTQRFTPSANLASGGLDSKRIVELYRAFATTKNA